MADINPDEPFELIIRGPRIDVSGLVAAIGAARDQYGGDGLVFQGRSNEIVDDFVGKFQKYENLGLITREAKRLVRDGEEFPFRGLQVSAGTFDPKMPGVEGFDIPEPTECTFFCATGKSDDGYFLASVPEHTHTEVALEVASMLRIAARELEETIDSTEARDTP